MRDSSTYPLNTNTLHRSVLHLVKWDNEKPAIRFGDQISSVFTHTSGLTNKVAKGKLVRTLATHYERVDRIQDYNDYECYRFSQLKNPGYDSLGSIVLCDVLVIIFIPLMEWPSA